MSTEDKYPNWFAVTAQTNFETYLLPLAGKNDLRLLQLGAFTGDASVWLAQHVLTGTNCWLIDVDTWEGSKEELHETMDFDEVFTLYKNKTATYGDKIKAFRSTTVSYLHGVRRDPSYDFIYVDADHTTVGVILDSELSWPQLKSGGIMAFDDYNWGNELPLHLRPRPGIDLFLLRHEGEFELLEKNEQVWIRKL